MFSLFVTHLAAEQKSGSFLIDRDRFLEFTDEKSKAFLRGLSKEAKNCLMSWPCLLMQEGRSEEVARMVEVTDIVASAGKVTATVRPAPKSVEILNKDLWNIRNELDLEQFEFSRNHWAVKDKDLFEVLKTSRIFVDSSVRQHFKIELPPEAARSDLLAVKDAIASVTHGDLDDLILETGVAGLKAGREVGTRRERANAIIRFALENPEAVTAENSLFSRFLIKKYLQPTQLPPNVTQFVPANPPEVEPAARPRSDSKFPNRVFVVHGRNESARTEVVAFLASLGLVGIVLHEQANMGQHLLTKFMGEAGLVTFAVVLMTDDDVGSVKGGTLAPRARQNVILELGYFIAYLGQAKVCALITPGLETPSDFDGIAYIKMANDQQWKVELLRELRAAKMPIISAH